MSDEFVEKKSVWKILLIIFVVLIILGGIGFGGYKLLHKTILNPKKYLINTKKYLNFNIFDDINIYSETNKDIKFNGNITYKTDNKELDYLNHLNINYNIISSFNKEEIQTNLKFNEDNKNLLDSNIYLIKDSLYLDSKDLYDKILFLSKSDVNIFNEIKNINKKSNETINGLKISINNYLDSLIDALKETKMSSEMVSIYQVKYTYEINDSNRDKIQSKYDELIKNNKTIQELIKKEIINKDLFNIKFTNIKVEIIKSIGTNKIYNINVIEDGKKTFTMEMDSKDDDVYHIVDGDDKGTLTIDKDTYTLQIFEKEELFTTIKMVNNNNLFKMSITANNKDLSFGLKKESKNKIIGTFVFKGKDDSIDLTVTVDKIDKGYDLSSIVDLVSNGEKIRMKVSGIEEIGDNLLETKDVSNSIDINSLNEKEQSKISENLTKKLQGSKLLELFSKEENSI